MDPLISIILPVFNGENYLTQSIESCLNQTYSNIELIIIDDCSYDRTPEIIEKYTLRDNRVRLLKNTENLKLPKSLNVGHDVAKGKFITWTSHDNIFNEDALELMYHEIQRYSVDIVYADMIIINEQNDFEKFFKNPEIEDILFCNPVGACFLYKREVYLKLNGYNDKLFLVEDYDFWLRGYLNFSFFHIPKYLYKFRVHSDSLSFGRITNSNRINLFRQNLDIMYRQFLVSIDTINFVQISDVLCQNVLNEEIKFKKLKEIFSDLEYLMLKSPLFNKNAKTKLQRQSLIRFFIRSMWYDAKNNFFDLKNALFVLYKFNFSLNRSQIHSFGAYVLLYIRQIIPFIK